MHGRKTRSQVRIVSFMGTRVPTERILLLNVMLLMELSYSRYGCECDQLNPNQQFSPLFWKLWKFKWETRTTAGKNECEAKKCFWKVLSVLCVKGHFFFPFEWMRYGAYKQGKWIIIVYVEWTRWPYECWNSICHDFVQHSTRAEHIWYGAKR